jgi:hypothetical protein
MRVALDRASEALQAAIALISRQIGIASLNMAGSTRLRHQPKRSQNSLNPALIPM